MCFAPSPVMDRSSKFIYILAVRSSSTGYFESSFSSNFRWWSSMSMIESHMVSADVGTVRL